MTRLNPVPFAPDTSWDFDPGERFAAPSHPHGTAHRAECQAVPGALKIIDCLFTPIRASRKNWHGVCLRIARAEQVLVVRPRFKQTATPFVMTWLQERQHRIHQ